LLTFNLAEQVKSQGHDSLKNTLSIVIPQRSGLAFADFKHYRIGNDSLYVLYQASTLDTTGEYELLEAYPLSPRDIKQLDSLLAKTDSFGHHTSGIFIMGWPRFLIYASYKSKSFDGYVANCYREHIFVFVDWLNQVYPNGEVISYDKEELFRREKEEDLRK